MKKLLFTIAFLFSIAYAQNISISKTDIDRVFSYPVNAKLFDNAVFSVQDTLLSKPRNAVYSRLSKFQGANLSITLVNGVYKGRILKSGFVYYELKYTNSTTYTFEKRNPTDIESELSYDPSTPTSTEAISLEDMKKSRELSALLSQDNDLALVQSGWGCILLDKDGYYLNSPMWNYGVPLVCAPASWTNSVDSAAYFLTRMKDFMYPFEIVVTFDSTVYAAAPLDKRIRTVITPTNFYGAGYLGISYVTSFTWGDDTPNFVFISSVNATNFLNLIETAKHEAGHPLGLYHQAKFDSATCVLQQSLSTGYGTGELSWCPIMGNPIGTKTAITWAFGPTSNGCTFLQDNLSIITTQNGIGYRSNTPSTYISSFAEARGLGAGEKTIRYANFMPVSADSASFKIVISKLGVTTIKASPSADGGATSVRALMTMKAKLYDLSGNFVAESNDNINSISGVIQQAIAPGTYYLRVYKRDLPQSICPAFFNPRGYGQYGWFFVTMD